MPHYLDSNGSADEQQTPDIPATWGPAAWKAHIVSAISLATGYIAMVHPGFTLPPEAVSLIPVAAVVGFVVMQAAHLVSHNSLIRAFLSARIVITKER